MDNKVVEWKARVQEAVAEKEAAARCVYTPEDVARLRRAVQDVVLAKKTLHYWRKQLCIPSDCDLF